MSYISHLQVKLIAASEAKPRGSDKVLAHHDICPRQRQWLQVWSTGGLMTSTEYSKLTEKELPEYHTIQYKSPVDHHEAEANRLCWDTGTWPLTAIMNWNSISFWTLIWCLVQQNVRFLPNLDPSIYPSISPWSNYSFMDRPWNFIG
jgi:hypothetical protein